MIQSAVTVSLVPEAKGGPFVFWDGLEDAFSNAAKLGYDAIEIFAPGPGAIESAELHGLIERYQLPVAAVGTGAGMVKHGLSLTDPLLAQREQAREFVKSMIDFGAEYKAPAIIGSMQGRWGGDLDQVTALGFLREALEQLGQYAETRGVPLIYEPLNRYESNLINTLAAGAELLEQLQTNQVKLLADLFHMNIEEVDLADALRGAAPHIGHVHFVDSNRQAAGCGHTDFDSIVAALIEMDYAGFLSVEAFPIPDSLTTAEKTIEMFAKYFRNAEA